MDPGVEKGGGEPTRDAVVGDVVSCQLSTFYSCTGVPFTSQAYLPVQAKIDGLESLYLTFYPRAMMDILHFGVFEPQNKRSNVRITIERRYDGGRLRMIRWLFEL